MSSSGAMVCGVIKPLHSLNLCIHSVGKLYFLGHSTLFTHARKGLKNLGCSTWTLPVGGKIVCKYSSSSAQAAPGADHVLMILKLTFLKTWFLR